MTKTNNNFSKTKNQHYVPRTYLRFFSIKKNDEYYIYVKDTKKDKQTFVSNINSIACERNFYENKYREQNYWENYYSKTIEPQITPLFNKIIALSKLLQNNSIILDDSTKETLICIIFSQMNRTKKARENYDTLSNNILNSFIKEFECKYGESLSKEKKKILDSHKDDFDLIHDTEQKEFSKEELINKAKLLLSKKSWIIYKNTIYKDCPFITSDNPIVCFNVLNNTEGFENNGLAEKGVSIAFPINNELLLVIYDYDIFSGVLRENDNKIIHIDEVGLILKINSYQINQCYNQIYYMI